MSRGDGHVHPTRDDRVVSALSEGVGGPVGDRATGHPWWSPVRVLVLLAALTFAVGMVQKTSCFADTWTDGEQRFSHMCYSDLPYLYTDRGFAERAWPYTDDEQVRGRYTVMEYPPVISYWAWATAWVTQGLSGSPDLDARARLPADALDGQPEVQSEVRWFVVVNAVGFAALLLLAAWFLAGAHRRRPWDAALLALSPALALNALVNWDLLALAMVAGALWAWSRDRPLLTGVLIGLGTATKLYPLFLLGGVLVICVCDRRVRAGVLTGLGAVGAWVLANAPAYLSSREAWTVFWTFNSDRGADLGSAWLVASQWTDIAFEPHTINTASWIFFIVWCVGVFVLGVLAPETPRLAQLGFLVVAGFLLVNKVYSPQYVLWLLPLAALARPRWRDHLVWQGAEVFYFASVWWYLGKYLDPAGGGDAGFYWLAIAVRIAGELYLVALVVRDILRPRHDPVRAAQPGTTSVPSNQSTTTRSNAVAV